MKDSLPLPVTPYQRRDAVPVTRWSGQKLFPTLVGFLNEKSATHLVKVILLFGIAGEREAFMYPNTKKGLAAGRFREAKMRDWVIDPGTLERLQETMKHEQSNS